MIFRAIFVHNNRDYDIWGQVFLDAKGNKYFRADHMSQAQPESKMLESLDKCSEWNIDYFLDSPEFSNLLNKLSPISISPFISP